MESPLQCSHAQGGTEEAINLADDPAWSAELEHLRDRTVELRKLYAGLVFKDGFESGDLAVWTVVN